MYLLFLVLPSRSSIKVLLDIKVFVEGSVARWQRDLLICRGPGPVILLLIIIA